MNLKKWSEIKDLRNKTLLLLGTHLTSPRQPIIIAAKEMGLAFETLEDFLKNKRKTFPKTLEKIRDWVEVQEIKRERNSYGEE